MSKKVLLAMSGGVDSSVAAILLQKAGYICTGARYQLLTSDDNCCKQDCEDACKVCQQLQMEFIEFDESRRFSETVKKLFIEGYQQGRTPNPCIDCNREIKFGRFLDEAIYRGYDYIATGHYARIGKDEKTGRFLVLKGLDAKKDQSYMLYQLTQQQLQHVLLPIGEYHKEDIREIAKEAQLTTAAKADSQDICFIPDGEYVEFLKRNGVAITQGDYLDKEGRVLGRHQGYQCYTTGQGKGLGIALGKHVYVISKDPEKNTVTLGDNEDLFTSSLMASACNWIAIENLDKRMECTAKTRYSHHEAKCIIEPKGDLVQVTFETPQRALTAGQAVVFYQGDVVLGGGTIDR